MRESRLGRRVRGLWGTPRRAVTAAGLTGAVLAAGAIALAQIPAAGAATTPARPPAKGTIIKTGNLKTNVILATKAHGNVRHAAPTSTTYSFLGKPVYSWVSDQADHVVITGTVDIGSSTIGTEASGRLAVCVQRYHQKLRPSPFVLPELFTTATEEFFPATASGVIGSLTKGKYHFGLCMASASANTRIGDVSGSVTLIQG
jgi:hypothetical protein